MAEIQEIVSYLKKLQRIIQREADFTFFSYKLIKKEKIDDILCCYLASLPDSYKKTMNNVTLKRRYNSMMNYKMLMQSVKLRFRFNSSVYLVKHKQAIDTISAIIATLEKDIKYIESN